MGSMFVDDPIQQEDIERMKQSDVLTDALNLAFAPEMKETLIDERDQYLAEKSDKPTVQRLSQWLEPDTYLESSVSLQKSMISRVGTSTSS